LRVLKPIDESSQPRGELEDVRGRVCYGAYRLTGVYVGRLFKGEKSADLPVERPGKIEFVINMRTAKTLGLTIPQSLVLRADQVIQ